MLDAFPPLPFPRFVPTPDLFWHASDLHGQAHVSRVMVHAIRLVEATSQQGLAPKLWATVFLHDLARLHDGMCHRHGAEAAKRLDDEPALQARLAEGGLTRRTIRRSRLPCARTPRRARCRVTTSTGRSSRS